MEKAHHQVSIKGLAFSMSLGLGSIGRDHEEEKIHEATHVDNDDNGKEEYDAHGNESLQRRQLYIYIYIYIYCWILWI